MSLLRGWTPEKVTLFAPDHQAVKESRKIAKPERWEQLGHDTYTVWGVYQGSNKSPYEVKLDTLKLQKDTTSGFGCTCPSRQKPCKHALALLFLTVQDPEAIPEVDTPQFVQEWLDKTAVRARKEQEKKRRGAEAAINQEQREQNYLERLEKIRDGLDELQLWVDNLIRHGLADPSLKSYTFWDDKAARMVDAKAPGVANMLREMGSLVMKGDDWLDDLLRELGKLHLIIEGFKRFEDLPPETRADLRTVVGWHLKKDEVDEESAVYDDWLVIGRFSGKVDDKLRTQRWWLRGIRTGRDVLIREYAWGDEPFDTYLEPGWALEADVKFYPSRYPLRALIAYQYDEPRTGLQAEGLTIQESVEAYSAALAKNPWLPEFPFLLDGVIPTRHGKDWVLLEDSGLAIPLSETFDHQWALMALSGGYPIQVGGEWNGQELMPTGAFAEDRFVNFDLLGKLT